ncbi:MAG: signal recognition particle protein [Chromatiales bacterium]|nr:signal recognition particle protein [Chromatiales bacterium]
MFEQLSNQFSTIANRLQGYKRLSGDHINNILTEIREALINADVALSVVDSFCSAIRDKASDIRIQKNINPGSILINLIKDELVALISDQDTQLKLKAKPPVVMLMVGLQGVGKTTTAVKLAHYLEKQKKMVALVSCDVHRPAAIDQLAVLCSQTKATCYPTPPNIQPEQIAKQAYERAARELYDVLIIDTAGRLHIDTTMMDEVVRIHRAVPTNEVLLAVDSMSGQDAVNSAKTFAESVPLTGIVLAKADGDSRGGAALSARVVTGKPIKLIGTGEKLEQLELFEPQRIAARILGLGEIESLLKDIEQKTDNKDIKKLSAKIKRAKFDLNDVKKQISQIQSMGGVASLIDKLPATLKNNAMLKSATQETQLKASVAVIDSMTLFERTHPEQLNGSRKKRISAGSGTTIQDINRVLKQHKQMQQAAKKLGKSAKTPKLPKGFMP